MYSPGDINIEGLTLLNVRDSGVNGVDFTGSFLGASIYESVFTPGTICDIAILDTQDILGTVKLFGDEQVFFTFSVSGSDTAGFIFALHDISDVQAGPGQKSKTYVLKCVSEEIMFDKTNNFQRCYDMLCSEMVEDIHKKFRNVGKVKKPIISEKTKGSQHIIIPGMHPMQAINVIRKRSISVEYPSNSFVYFESRINEQSVFNFVTVENMFANTTITKTFYQSDAINTDFGGPRVDNNIISYKVDKQVNSINLVKALSSNIQEINLTTQDFTSNIIKPNDADFKTGSATSTSSISKYFRNSYVDSITNPPRKIIPTDNSPGRGITHIVDGTPYHETYKALLGRNSMRIRVIGDTVISPGIIINLNIPVKSGLTGTINNDPLLSGNFLVTRVHHRIGVKNVEKPRYTCIIECIKAGYDEGATK
jgi:hypothetical protein